LIRNDGTVDPEAKLPVTLKDCFDGPFADDVGDKARRLTLKTLLARCRDEEEVEDHFDEALEYCLEKAWLIPPIAWSNQIYDKALFEWYDARKSAKRKQPTSDAIGDLIAVIQVDQQPSPSGVAEANEANDGTHEILSRRYDGPLDFVIAGVDIMRTYADLLHADEAEQNSLAADLHEQICTCCGEGTDSLRLAADLWMQACAVFHVEDPLYREQQAMDSALQRFAAAEDLVVQGKDRRVCRAFWLMEWGWDRAAAIQAVGLDNSPNWMKAVNRFREYVDRDAPAIRLAKSDKQQNLCPLARHVPPARTVDAP
jgi:hypothetical protein